MKLRGALFFNLMFVSAFFLLTSFKSKTAQNLKLQVIPVAELSVLEAINSNVTKGQIIQVGQVIKTNNVNIKNSKLNLGGYVKASSWAWGVKELLLKEGSSVSIKSYALCAGGGRILELNVKGTIYVRTRYLTQSCSAVRVCLGIGKGCVTLRSAMKARNLEGDKYVVSVAEGVGTAQDVDQIKPPVIILAGQYSIMREDGSFTPVINVKNTDKKYRIITQTKNTQHIEAKEGWLIRDKNKDVKTTTVIVGAPINLKSPLD